MRRLYEYIANKSTLHISLIKTSLSSNVISGIEFIIQHDFVAKRNHVP